MLPVLSVVLVLCLAAVALPTIPAQAVCRYPEMSLSSDRGVPGDIITITGSDFDPHEYVDIYYGDMPMGHTTVDSSRRFQFTVEIPPSPTGHYTIRALGLIDGQVVEENAVFRVTPGMTVSPESGPIGSEVTVKGRGFAADETGIEVRYYLDGVRGPHERVVDNVEADASGSWEAVFEVPNVAGGEYEISARGSKTLRPQAIRPAVFRVGAGIGVGEPSGAVGESIPVSGVGFAANETGIRILVDGRMVPTVPADIRADDSGHWQASFEVPDRTKGEYRVTAAGDITSGHDVGGVAFEIRPAIGLSPDEGHVGTEVTVTGRGFAANTDVVLIYDDDDVATATADEEGRFEESFIVPESRHGEQPVKAKTIESPNAVAGAGNALAIFTMESEPPPTPELISPVDRQRMGFVFRVSPTLEWSGVFDESGVYYNLQVSTSPDCDGNGAFAEPLLTREGLTETSYTPAEGLPYGTYYWTVQAVDGAANKGEWTTVDSFRVGRLPLWAFIVIISFLALLLGLRTYFILVRPRLYD